MKFSSFKLYFCFFFLISFLNFKTVYSASFTFPSTLTTNTSDFVLLALPLDKDTENIIGPKQLRLIGKDGVIINVARGGLIDEGALYNACRHRVVGGAIIDTWYNYPNQSSLPQQPSKFDFNVLENIIMTPHSSAWTDNLIPRRCRKMARNLDKVYLNQKPINIVREPLRE